MTDERSPYRVSQRPGAGIPHRCLACGDVINATGHCARCGSPATPSDVRGIELTPECPRCSESLAPIVFGGGAVLRCPGCAGALVTPADWTDILENVDAERTVAAQMVPPLPGKKLPEGALAALVRCPVCRQEMDRYRFASLTEVTVDACGVHGLWFDARELGAVLQRIHARDEAALSGRRSPEDEAAELEWARHVARLQELAVEAAADRSVGLTTTEYRRDDLATVLGAVVLLTRG